MFKKKKKILAESLSLQPVLGVWESRYTLAQIRPWKEYHEWVRTALRTEGGPCSEVFGLWAQAGMKPTGELVGKGGGQHPALLSPACQPWILTDCLTPSQPLKASRGRPTVTFQKQTTRRGCVYEWRYLIPETRLSLETLFTLLENGNGKEEGRLYQISPYVPTIYMQKCGARKSFAR